MMAYAPACFTDPVCAPPPPMAAPIVDCPAPDVFLCDEEEDYFLSGIIDLEEEELDSEHSPEERGAGSSEREPGLLHIPPEDSSEGLQQEGETGKWRTGSWLGSSSVGASSSSGAIPGSRWGDSSRLGREEEEEATKKGSHSKSCWEPKTEIYSGSYVGDYGRGYGTSSGSAPWSAYSNSGGWGAT